MCLNIGSGLEEAQFCIIHVDISGLELVERDEIGARIFGRWTPIGDYRFLAGKAVDVFL